MRDKCNKKIIMHQMVNMSGKHTIRQILKKNERHVEIINENDVVYFVNMNVLP